MMQLVPQVTSKVTLILDVCIATLHSNVKLHSLGLEPYIPYNRIIAI